MAKRIKSRCSSPCVSPFVFVVEVFVEKSHFSSSGGGGKEGSLSSLSSTRTKVFKMNLQTFPTRRRKKFYAIRVDLKKRKREKNSPVTRVTWKRRFATREKREQAGLISIVRWKIPFDLSRPPSIREFLISLFFPFLFLFKMQNVRAV